MAPILAEAARKGQFLWMNHGLSLTSTCHVENCVEGMLLAAERGRHGEVRAAGNGGPTLWES